MLGIKPIKLDRSIMQLNNEVDNGTDYNGYTVIGNGITLGSSGIAVVSDGTASTARSTSRLDNESHHSVIFGLSGYTGSTATDFGFKGIENADAVTYNDEAYTDGIHVLDVYTGTNVTTDFAVYNNAGAGIEYTIEILAVIKTSYREENKGESTPEELTDNPHVVGNNCPGYIKTSKVGKQEFDTTWNFADAVFDEEVVGKNIWDGSFLNSYVDTSDSGKLKSGNSYALIAKVSEGNQYTVSSVDGNRNIWAYYDSYPVINTTTALSYGTSVTSGVAPSGSKYIAFYVMNTTEQPTNLQLEYGTSATSYVPYNSQTRHTDASTVFHDDMTIWDSIDADGVAHKGGSDKTAILSGTAINTTNFADALSGGSYIIELTAGGNQEGTVDNAETASGDGVIRYQLATEIQTDLNQEPLLCEPSATYTISASVLEPTVTLSYPIMEGDSRYTKITDTVPYGVSDVIYTP